MIGGKNPKKQGRCIYIVFIITANEVAVSAPSIEAFKLFSYFLRIS
jgi:hypothetical protein